MIEFTYPEIIILMQMVNEELSLLKDMQNRVVLEGHELKHKEVLHSIDAKLDNEFTRLAYKPKMLRDL